MLKLVVLVRRGENVSHEELVAKWQDAHMPAVIKHVQPDRYRVTFFDAANAPRYDGMAVAVASCAFGRVVCTNYSDYYGSII